MSQERDMLGDTGRKAVMFSQWSWRRSEFGTIRATSESGRLSTISPSTGPPFCTLMKLTLLTRTAMSTASSRLGLMASSSNSHRLHHSSRPSRGLWPSRPYPRLTPIPADANALMPLQVGIAITARQIRNTRRAATPMATGKLIPKLKPKPDPPRTTWKKCPPSKPSRSNTRTSSARN